MTEEAEQIPQNQIVLHEDKKYYATAMEVTCFFVCSNSNGTRYFFSKPSRSLGVFVWSYRYN